MEENPYVCFPHRLNDIDLVQFLNINTSKNGICAYNPNNLYLLIEDDVVNVVKRDINLKLYYNYDFANFNVSYVDDVGNKMIEHNPELYNIFNLIYTQSLQYIKQNSQELMRQLNIVLCEINHIKINLTEAQSIVEYINREILSKHCENGNFRFELDYGYLFNYMPMYEESVHNVIDFANTIFLCITHYGRCVSSINLNIYKQNQDDRHNVISITSKTIDIYERNKFNQMLRLLTMIISQQIPSELPINFIYSEAQNPISAYTLKKLFPRAILDDDFVDYLRENNVQEKELSFKIFEDYLEGEAIDDDDDEDDEEDDNPEFIYIYVQITEKEIINAYEKLVTTIKQLNCDLEYLLQQGGNFIKNKCAKYQYKLKNKHTDLYLDKLLYWNTLYTLQSIKNKIYINNI